MLSGGTFLQKLLDSDLAQQLAIHALVRTDEQAKAVVGLGAIPIIASLDDNATIRKVVAENSGVCMGQNDK